MPHPEKRIQCFFRLPESLVEKFDNCLRRLGYTKRADLFTAVAYYIIDIDAKKEDELAFTTAAKLKGNSSFPLTEYQIRCKLQSMIDTMVKPVIARHGAKHACDATLPDIRDAFLEQNNILLTDEEIREGFRQYDLVNKYELRQYQLNLIHPVQKEEQNL